MALFAVLAFLILIAAAITPISVSAHIDALVTRNSIRETQDRFAVEGIVRLAGAVYAERAYALRGRPNVKMPSRIACFDDGRESNITFAFLNHSGLVDLNAASPELLEVGFRALGVEAGRASALAVEAERYRSAEPPDGGGGDQRYKRAPFETVFELGDLASGDKRLSSALLYQAAPSVFTIHSKSGTLDTSVAPVAVASAARTLGTRDAPYLVEDGGRLPALTIIAAVRRPGRPDVTASGVYAVELSEDAAAVRILEPMRLRSADSDAEPADTARAGCDTLFAPPLRQAMFEVLR
ncbi:hypothetical protein [Oricola cellulosilytica]|nr:hypothetical protein [Oricola cellulosilytica]